MNPKILVTFKIKPPIHMKKVSFFFNFDGSLFIRYAINKLYIY